MKPSETKLSEVAEFIRGINFKPDDVVPLGTEGSVGCMRTKNVQDELDCMDVWGVPKEFVRRDEQLLKEGDILVSSANSWNLVGKCCWIPKLDWPASFGGFVSVLRANPHKVDPRFLYRWFASNPTQALLRSFGQKTTNISNLNIERCLNLKLVLPPLPEQRRIAAILDQADALRAKRREALAELDQLTQSIFIDMFGDPVANPAKWNKLPLAELVAGKYGVKAGPFGSALKKEEYGSSGYRVYGQEQVIAGRFDVGDYYISERKYEQLKSCSIAEGDLLVSLVGSFGKILIVPSGIEPGIINPRLLKISPNRKLLTSKFLASVLEHPSVQKHFEQVAHGGTMGILNAGLLKQLDVILPPLHLQAAFANRLESATQIALAHKKSLLELDSLFSSLQHRAFRGEL